MPFTPKTASKPQWAIAFAIGAGLITAFFMADHAMLPVGASVAALLGGVIGWRLASRWNVNQAIAYVDSVGGVENLLDRHGREMLTVWIPFDQTITDDNVQSVKKLGQVFEREVPRAVGGFSAVETSWRRVGLVIIGRDAEKMLEQIRPFFKQHCPRGTYVTRRRLQRDSDIPLTWPHPRPIFEDDQIPEE